ncbi:ubiquitin carboxyl-terminal hydrolase 48-like [Takifugu flavidus]|uniref:ubiquitin carboxyl-terminal hydrolase 48-like n=1 Tax=Takifugu flavidus TaxID=433684 RepID=UPI002544A301|nr:ubiquitin carboxyl-terminal hydrolase 48-like [Takifugu flavidus]
MLWYKYDGRIIFAPQMIGAILHELRPCSWTCGKTPEASVDEPVSDYAAMDDVYQVGTPEEGFKGERSGFLASPLIWDV